jgi:tRNA (guanine-N7-)-methyltransferase
MVLGRNCFPEGIFLSHHDLSRPMDWWTRFGNDAPLHLEIGFGFGEFLIQQMGSVVQENFIGIEQDWSRLTKCLSKIEGLRKSSGNKVFGENLRLLRIDATVALQRLFMPRSLDQVTCLFPCPWPKVSHIKHRLFSRDFLCLLNNRLKDKSRLKLVTDWYPYLEWIVAETEDTGFEFEVKVIAPQFNTKFERKWQAAGQDKFWELTLIKAEHRDVPIVEDIEVRALFVKEFNHQHFNFKNRTGEVSVICKDFIFDQKQNLGLVRLIVAEPFLTQHVWVAIIKTQDQWCVAKADGHSALPTSGVALAIECVAQAASESVRQADV